MLEKLISIKNIGKLAKLNLRNGNWDGVFSRSNIIYAPNGTGKTTLSMIFQSMKGDENLIKKKITFEAIRSEYKSQHFSIRANGDTTEYKNDVWTNPIKGIEIFNVHFVEDNLFTGSGQHRKNQQNLFIFLSGEDGSRRKAEIATLRNKTIDYRKKSRLLKVEHGRAPLRSRRRTHNCNSSAQRKHQLKMR